jgi:eukaryotic-like serine/threonine-protein kinase
MNNYGLQGLVVCSRIKDYTDLNVRLAFYRAIYIQPLTSEQIDEYLKRAGEKLASLSAIIQADDPLRSLAQSPLILNIMTLAYQNASAEALIEATLNTNEDRRRHLFDAYISRMFKRKAGTAQYDDEQTKRHLSWLAQNMQRHNQEVFLIESLQPSWLAVHRWQWIYFLVSRLISSLLVWLSVFAGYRLLFVDMGDMRQIPIWIPGLIGGLSIGFVDILRFEWVRKRKETKKSSTFWWSIISILAVGLVGGLSAGLIPGLTLGFQYGLFAGISFGSLNGLIFGSRGNRQNPENDIQTVKAIRWSWKKALKSGLGLGRIVWVLVTLIMPFVRPFGEPTEPFDLAEMMFDIIFGLLFAGPSLGLVIGLVAAFFGGWSREIVESKSVANQGIWLSVRNAIFSGLCFGLFLGLCAGLIGETKIFVDLHTGEGFPLWGNALRWGGLLGVVVGALWYGGLDVIQHYTLRLILIVQGHTPWNYARFLDYATDRIFLQKVGGGYRFIHRLLLEHFVDMNENSL